MLRPSQRWPNDNLVEIGRVVFRRPDCLRTCLQGSMTVNFER